MKLQNQVGRGQGITSLRSTSLIHSRHSTSPPPHHSILSPSTQPHQPTSSSVGRHVPPSSCPSYPSPAVLLLPSFFINYRSSRAEAQWTSRGMVPSLLAQLAGPAVAAPSSSHPCSSPNQVPRLLSGSNGILSAAIGTIGKQRLKMNYPVSFSSLTNK